MSMVAQRVVYKLVAVEDAGGRTNNRRAWRGSSPFSSPTKHGKHHAWSTSPKKVVANDVVANANRHLKYNRADRAILKNSFQSSPCTTPSSRSPTLTPNKLQSRSSWTGVAEPVSNFRMNLFPCFEPSVRPASPVPTYVPPHMRASMSVSSSLSSSPASSPTPSECMSDDEEPKPKRRRRRKKRSESGDSSETETTGKLQGLVRYFFCHAYGLEGVTKRSHAEVITDARSMTQCSLRAVNEALYGHSYGHELHELRELVPGYPSNKVMNRMRNQQLEETLLAIEQGELQHITAFDGNGM